MRLVEDDKQIRYGKIEQMDARELDLLEKSIAEIVAISRTLWAFIHASPRISGEL
jgi:hypothetical protein